MSRRGGVIRVPQAVDMLMLIKEEEISANRICEQLLYSEQELMRPPMLLSQYDRERTEKHKADYERISPQESNRRTSPDLVSRRRSSSPKIILESINEETSADYSDSSTTFVNSPINMRRTVSSEDVVYTEDRKPNITYLELLLASVGKKQILTRTLRTISNWWGKPVNLRKNEALKVITIEYARRYPQEAHDDEIEFNRIMDLDKIRKRRKKRKVR